MRIVTSLLLACLGVFGVSDAQAGTLTNIYFVGDPWRINNELGPDRSLMAVGHLQVDPSALPGGTLANHRTQAIFDSGGFEVVTTPDFRSMTVDRIRSDREDHRLLVDVQFGSDAMPRQWTVMQEPYDVFCYERCYLSEGDTATGAGRTVYTSMFYKEDFLGNVPERDRYLRDLGYTPDMPAYQKFIGDDEYWGFEKVSDGPGAWFATLDDAARAIERNTRIALANPAKGLHEIAPIPVPAPLVLLLAGLGALGLMARRRT
jgi:hypothetical protein